MRKFLWTVVLLLAGCAAAPREEVPPAAPPAPATPAAPAETWNVVGSSLTLRVYRDGPMQKLGHNHLITSDRLSGKVLLREPITASGFELSLPLESLVVDDDTARSRAGAEFAAPVPQKDRDATRRNMLGEQLLDAAHHPEVRLSAESMAGTAGRYQARVRVSLAGGERVVTVPFTVMIEGSQLEVRSSFRLNHAEVGLVPFNVALGALKVRDEFEIDLMMAARRGS